MRRADYLIKRASFAVVTVFVALAVESNVLAKKRAKKAEECLFMRGMLPTGRGVRQSKSWEAEKCTGRGKP